MMNENPQRVIKEEDYAIPAQMENAPTAIGKGGDPLFKTMHVAKEDLLKLIEETQVVQDWVQKEISNNVAISYLKSENLLDAYNTIKNGFGDYGRILLMGFKSPTGAEIPRLKIFSPDGNVLQVISGPMVSVEINKRLSEYNNLFNTYEQIEEILEEDNTQIITSEISDY